MAAIVYLIVTVLRINKIAPLSQLEWIVCIAAGVFFLLTVASGGWLSAAKDLPAIARTLHKVLPVLTVLATVITFYLLNRRS